MEEYLDKKQEKERKKQEKKLLEEQKLLDEQKSLEAAEKLQDSIGNNRGVRGAAKGSSLVSDNQSDNKSNKAKRGRPSSASKDTPTFKITPDEQQIIKQDETDNV